MAQMGRPKSDDPMNKDLKIRLRESEYEEMRNARTEYNLTSREILLRGLEKVKEEHKQK